VSEKAGQARKNANGMSTMDTLVHFGMEELKRSGSIDFNLENVLRESGVARGSLYHHFGSRHGLIAHCEAQMLKESLKSENELIRVLIESGKNGEELFTMLSTFILSMGSDAMTEQRGRRIRTLAAAVEDPALRTMLAESQMKGSKYLSESYEMAKQMGFIDPLVDTDTIVYLTQAMFLGRVLVDITENPQLSDSINEAIVLVLRTLMNPQSGD
jgi:AcrR family transcriptional regulator